MGRLFSHPSIHFTDDKLSVNWPQIGLDVGRKNYLHIVVVLYRKYIVSLNRANELELEAHSESWQLAKTIRLKNAKT